MRIARLAIFAVVFPLSASATLIPTSQQRYALVETDEPGDPDYNRERVDAADFGVFDVRLHSFSGDGAGCRDFAVAWGEQTSTIGPSSIAVFARASADGRGDGCSGVPALAMSEFSVEFELALAHDAELSGDALRASGGTFFDAWLDLSLVGGSGPLISYSLMNEDPVDIGWSGQLPAGSYTLLLSTRASGFSVETFAELSEARANLVLSLRPVPEPTTAVLLGLCLAAVAAATRRRP